VRMTATATATTTGSARCVEHAQRVWRSSR
jgi:hypothetical protein